MKNKLRTLNAGGHLGDDEEMKRDVEPMVTEDDREYQQQRSMTREEYEAMEADFLNAGMMPPTPLELNANFYNGNNDDDEPGGNPPEPCDCKSKKIQPLAPVGIDLEN